MTYAEICETVENLKKQYDESDPFKLCEAKDILVLFHPMGNRPTSIKGFSVVIKGIRSITVNSDLPGIIQRIIGAHELGHALMHCNGNLHPFHDVTLFDQTSAMEKEANLFAAELLLDDQAVLDALNQDVTFFSAAKILCVPADLLDLKFRLLKWKGYKLVEPPITARNNFLRDMEVPPNDEGSYS